MPKRIFVLALLGALLLIVKGFVLAWVEPTLPPPAGNVSAPINVGSNNQAKTGNLGVGGTNTANKLQITGDAGISGWLGAGCESVVAGSCEGGGGYSLLYPSGYGVFTAGLKVGANEAITGSSIKADGDVQGSRLCIGTDCRNSWAAVGSNYWLPSGANIYSNITGNVGIGTTAPTAKLEVAGQVKITGGTPGAGKVLTSDAAGLATWQTPAASGVGGSGTINYVPKFTAASTLGNSIISDNATILTVQSPGPALRLQDNNSDGSAAVSYIEFYDSNSRQGFIGFGSSLNSDMFFANQENGNWIFSGSGGMGISTTTPYGAKLNVADGPIKASGGLILENRTTNIASPESGAIWICVDTGEDCQ